METVVQFTIILILRAALTGSSEAVQDSGDIAVSRRPRRMIWAAPLTDSQAPFSSPKWYVYMAYGNGMSKFLMHLYRYIGWSHIGEPVVSPFNGNCGGSLLTPKVVGSACHCFHQEVKENFTFVRFLPWNSWEQYLAVFHGYYTKQDMEANLISGTWAWSKRFVVHEKCGKILTDSNNTKSGKLVYDFGLIMLTREMQLVKPGSAMVPLYLPQDIIKAYNNIQKKEAICLAIGFGKYSWEAPGIPGPDSPVLMHGWRNVQNYEFCRWLFNLNFYNKKKQKAYGLDDNVITALCHIPFGKIRAATMYGDSGGPVTCGNVYVGLNSHGVHLDLIPGNHIRPRLLVSWAAAIAFAIEWHSAEHRADMLKYLDDYAKKPEFYTTVNTFRPWVGKYFNDRTPLNSSPIVSPSSTAITFAALSILEYGV